MQIRDKSKLMKSSDTDACHATTRLYSVAVLAHKIWGHGPMASAIARTYNGGLGQSPQRGPGAEPLVRRSERRNPPEAKHFWFLNV